MKLLFVGAEALPFASTGGLADVLGSLPAALKREKGDDLDIRVDLADKLIEIIRKRIIIINQ